MSRSDIERVVDFIYERYSEPITLPDMAEVARLSQFHFSRTFQAATGVSPGRFLSAVRLHQAKGLLLNTTETVTAISFLVGYNSLGTFTTRFTRSVGLSPNQYRRASGNIAGVPDFDKVCGERGKNACGSISGSVTVPKGNGISRVFLGLFDGAIVQGPLVAGTVIHSMDFGLPSVPAGEWHVVAVAVGAGMPADEPYRGDGAARVRMVARVGPLKVIGGDELHVQLTMRHVEPTDPPILLALPDFDAVVEANRTTENWATKKM